MDGSATFYDEAAINKNMNINDCNECCLRWKLFFYDLFECGRPNRELSNSGKGKNQNKWIKILYNCFSASASMKFSGVSHPLYTSQIGILAFRFCDYKYPLLKPHWHKNIFQSMKTFLFITAIIVCLFSQGQADDWQDWVLEQNGYPQNFSFTEPSPPTGYDRTTIADVSGQYYFYIRSRQY